MFLSSWLGSFRQAVRHSTRSLNSRGRRVLPRERYLKSGEQLEERCLLILPPTFNFASPPVQIPPAPALPVLRISHASSPGGDPTGLEQILINQLNFPANQQTPGPYASQITLKNLNDPDSFFAGSFTITATSSNTQIAQGLDSANDPNFDVKIERQNDTAYIRFAPGPALFGETTVNIQVIDSQFDVTSRQIRIRLDDPPKVDPLSNRTVPEDAGLQTISLTGISAGGNADDPSNGGQNRLIYANSNKPKLTGIPTIQYDQLAMDKIGSLLFSPIKGQPVDIKNLGDNEATITVSIEDAGIDNIVGKAYDPATGDLTITNYNATLDNQIRTQTFRFTIVPVNDVPTLDPQNSSLLPDITINEDQASPLATDITSSQTTITLVDASLFPATAPFTVQVESEQMLVTAVAGSNFTVTRAFGGTLAAAHSRGQLVSPSTTLTGITAGGGSSPIGNELQNVRISPTTANGGFFTLTFDNGVHSYTTDLISHDAPATDSRNETLFATSSSNDGTFSLILADNIGAVTSLDSAIDNTQITFAVDNLTGFPITTPFYVSIDSEEMLVTDVANAPVSGNPLRKSVTVTRGIHGTAAATHTDFASVLEIRTEEARSNAGQLTSVLDGISTSFTLANPTTLPNVPFTIQIEFEQMQVTAVTGGNTLTIVRGINNTTAAPHTGSIVSPLSVDTAGVLGLFIQTLNAGGTAVTLSNSVSLPVAPFTILIEQEQMRVTTVVGNVLTVVRGVNGTTDVAHVGSLFAPLAVTMLTALGAAPATQLPTSISNATTTINVSNGAIFPTADITDPTTYFFIRIDREDMQVTNRANNVLTVVRGANGTTPAAHGSGAAHPVSRIDDILRVVDSAIFTSAAPYDIRIDNEDLRVTAINGNELTVIRGIHGTLLGAHGDSARISRIQTSSAINHDATASEIQSALGSIPLVGTNGVQVTNGPLNAPAPLPIQIEFIGPLGHVNLDRLTADTGNLNGNEIVQLNYNGQGVNGSGTASGTFTITFGGRTTGPIPFDADALTIAAALTAPGMQPVLNPGDIIVKGGALPGAPIRIEYTGQYANTNLPANALTTNTTNVFNNERQQITFNGSPTGGSFQLLYTDTNRILGGFVGQQYATGQIPYDGTDVGTAQFIEAALESLGSGMNVTVTPVSTTSWIVEFTGPTVQDRDHPALIPLPRSGATGNQLTPVGTVINVQTLEDGDRTLGPSKTLGTPTLVVNGLSPSIGLFPQIDGAISVQDALIDLQSLTAADISASGTGLPGLPVTVEFVGAYAGLDLNLMTVNNSPLPQSGLVDFGNAASVTDDVSGPLGVPDGTVDILDRHFDGESQKLAVTAVSDNADIVPDPIVNYTSPQGTATLTFRNNRDRFGTATITVTVMDSGFDQKLETVGDNAMVTKKFKVTVLPTNDAPTINTLPDVSVPKNTVSIPLALAGISTGGNETQDLRVTASSSNDLLLPNPSVNYSNGAASGLLTLEPIAGVVGFSIVTVTVEDAGIDGSLNSTADNGVTEITFRLDVSEPPTLGATPATISIPEGSPLLNQSLNVTAGGSESQPLRLTVSNTNSALFPTPTNLGITYTTPNPTGTLNYQPVAQLSGSDVFHLTLEDGGPDGLLGIPGALAADLSPTATLLTAADASIFPAVPANKLAIAMTRTDTTVTLINAAAFPPTASPLNTFKIQVDNELMTVTGVTGNTFTVVRGKDGTPVGPHNANDVVVKPFKIQIENEIMRVTAVAGSNLSLVRGVNGTSAAQHFTTNVIVHPNAFDNLKITRDIGVTVTPVNDLPVLAMFIPNPFTVPEGSGQQIVSLSGISDGEGPGARQHLTVSAVSSNPTLTGPISVFYTDGDAIGTLRFTPDPSLAGTATITVTVRDGGLDNNLGTPETNDTFSRNLTVNVVPIGDLPTLAAISNRTLNEDAASQLVSLTGISDGDNNTQDLLMTTTTTDTNLISNLILNYNPTNLQFTTGGTPPSTGSLTFTPGADRFGSATITVTVEDGGNDSRLGRDTLTANTTASGATTVLIANSTRFPVPASVPFNIVIDNEEMIVSSISGPGGTTFNILPGGRAQNGTVAAAHTSGAAVTAPNTAADNVSFSRTFNVTVKPVNDAPRINPPVATINILEDAVPPPISLTGIDAGPFESLTLATEEKVAVSVTSNNASLIPNPTVSFTEPTLGVAGSGSAIVTYQPVANKFGTATLTVQIMDAGLDRQLNTLSDNGFTYKTIVVNVAAVNDKPEISAVAPVTVAEESSEKTVSLAGINAGGGESQILKVTSAVFSSSIAGLITNLSTSYTSQNPTGSFKFTPGANLFGTAIIRVTVEDAGFDGVLATTGGPGGNETFFQDVVINVTNGADAPTLTLPAAATINKSGYVINSVTLNGISDGDLNTQTITVTATSDNPTLVPNPTVNFTQSGVSPSTALQMATLVFNPAADQLGTANITVVVSDGVGSSVSKMFLLTVANVNLPPTIDPIATINLTEPTFPAVPAPQMVSLSGITAGGNESQALTVTATSSNTAAIPNPIVTYSSADPTGSLTFTPTQDAAGTFTITVRVADAAGNFTDMPFSVVIAQGDNDNPVMSVIPDSVFKVGASTLRTVNLTGIAAGPFESAAVGVTIQGASDPNGILSGLTVTSPTLPGTASTDSLTFNTANMSGTATITVRVTDDIGLTFDRTFSVFVVNPPTINNITNPAAVPEDTLGTQSVSLTGISDGDAGAEGVEVSVSILSDPSGLIQNPAVLFAPSTAATGSVTYDLAANKSGTATIQVTVKDQGPNLGFNTGDESTVTKTFTVTVNPVNDDPTLDDQLAALVLLEDATSGTISLTGISAGPFENQMLQVTAVSNALSKVTVQSVSYVQGQPTGSVVIKPVANASGTATITVTVKDTAAIDGIARMVSKDFTVNITAVNDQPTLDLPTNITVLEDSGAGTITLTGITAGGSESQTLSVSAVSDNHELMLDPTVTYNSPDNTATLHFTPLADKAADAFITVTVTDDGSVDGTPKSVSRTFRITVTEVNDAPVFEPAADSVTIDEGLANGTQVFDSGVIDPEGRYNSLAFSILPAGNIGGAFSIGNDGIVRVANAAALNFEATPVFLLTVRVIDNTPIAPTGQVVTHDFIVNLNDLAETLTVGANNWPASGGLTIKRTGDGKVHVLNSSNVDVVPAHVFANITQIQVTGQAGVADVLTVDYSGGLDPVPTGVSQGLTFNGGSGLGDTLRFANATFADRLDTTFSGATSALIEDSAAVRGTISLTGIESIGFNTTVTAANLNFVYGAGNDTITFADDSSANGLTGFSSLSSPAVTFPTGAGVTIETGDGNNVVTFNSVENSAGPAITVQGGSGADQLKAPGVGRAVALFGGAGNDTLVGGSGADSLDGEGDDDLLTGGLGNDTLEGGSGDNTLYETTEIGSLTLGSTTMTGLGNDNISGLQFAILVGGAGANALNASSFGGRVTLTGGGGNDTLTGSDNDDQLTGGDGNDQINGGGGDDTLIESGNVNFILGAATLTGLGSDTISGIEFAKLTGGASANTLDATNFTGDVALFGGGGNDLLKGGAGDDALFGEAGDDTLTGAGGANDLDGGDGTDQVAESGDVNFTLTATQLTGAGTDQLLRIETAKLSGGDSGNTLNASGFAGNTTLQGNKGADTLIGGSKADSLEGGDGDDLLTGGLGDDTFNGGAGNDTIIESGLTTLSMTPTSMSGRGADRLTSMEAGRFTGTAFNNTLSGGTFPGALTIDGLEGNDNLTGGSGNDTIGGGDGADTVNGGGGNDRILGGAGKDRLSGGTGNDQIDGGADNDTLKGEAGNDTIVGGSGNDSISGGENDDAIDGQSGDDTIAGENGNDTLIGGTGKDLINGGAGNDKLWSGDYRANTSSPNDGDKDTLISGTGTDTVTGETALDLLTDASNTASEKIAAFIIDYHGIFGALVGP